MFVYLQYSNLFLCSLFSWISKKQQILLLYGKDGKMKFAHENRSDHSDAILWKRLSAVSKKLDGYSRNLQYRRLLWAKERDLRKIQNLSEKLRR